MNAIDLVNPSAHATTLDAEHPWPGLAPFPEAGRNFFHGRDREIDRLVRLVRDEPLVLLHGESGLGKTSLLQAGLFPRLRNHDLLPVLVRLDFSPSAEPLAQQVRDRLDEELERGSIEGPRPQASERLWEYSHRPDGWLWSPRQTPVLPVVVLDQFEEMFTLGGGLSAPGVRDFVDGMAEVVLDRVPARDIERLDRFDRSRPGLKVVLSFREEFLAHVEELLPEFGPAMQARLRLTAFDQAVAERSVLGSGGPLVRPEVAQTIVRVVSGGRDTVEPSLLSVFCRELNERRLSDRAPTISPALVASAGAAVLPAFYARSTTDVAESVLEFVEEKLLTEGQRRNIVTMEEAVAAPGVTRAALETLVRRRLVRIEERFGAERVELAHDVLAPIVAEVRRDRRARREERRLKERLEQERHAAQKLKKERTRLSVLLAVAMTGMVLAAAGGIVAWRALKKATVSEEQERMAKKQAEGARATAEDNLRKLQEEQRKTTEANTQLTRSLDGERRAREEAQYERYVALWQSLARDVARDAADHVDDERTALLARQAMLFHSNTPEQPQYVVEAALQRMSTQEPFSHILKGHESSVTSVTFARDGQTIASAGLDDTVRVWHIGQPRSPPLVLTSHQFIVHAVAFSPEGQLLASAGYDKTVRIWDLGHPQSPAIVLKGHDESVESVAFSPDGQLLASGSVDQTVRVWKFREPQTPPLVLRGHVNVVSGVAFAPDGQRLASASHDETLRVWDLRQPQAPPVILTGHDGRVTSVSFASDNLHIASASYDKTVRVWDLNQPQKPLILTGHQEFVLSVAFSPDGRRLASGGGDKTVRLWDLRQSPALPVTFSGHQELVSSVAFASDGQRLASAGEDVRVWDLYPPRVPPSVLSEKVGLSTLAPDGLRLASGDGSGTVRVWDLHQPEAPPVVLTGHGERVRSLTFAPNSLRLASGSEDNTIRVWDLRQPKAPPLVLAGHRRMVVSLAFAPDGERLASGSADRTVRVWDLRKRQVDSLVLDNQRAVAEPVVFAHDGQHLAIGGAFAIRVWNLREPNGRPLVLTDQSAKGIVADVAFAPDDRRLAVASTDDNVRVWDLREPQAPPITLARHEGKTTSVVFASDGHRVAAGGIDDTISVWDLRQPQASPVILSRHHGGMESIAFVANSQQLASVNSDGRVQVWPLWSSAADRLCKVVWRNLSTEEWDFYIGADIPYQNTCPNLPRGEGTRKPK